MFKASLWAKTVKDVLKRLWVIKRSLVGTSTSYRVVKFPINTQSLHLIYALLKGLMDCPLNTGSSQVTREDPYHSTLIAHCTVDYYRLQDSIQSSKMEHNYCQMAFSGALIEEYTYNCLFCIQFLTIFLITEDDSKLQTWMLVYKQSTLLCTGGKLNPLWQNLLLIIAYSYQSYLMKEFHIFRMYS